MFWKLFGSLLPGLFEEETPIIKEKYMSTEITWDDIVDAANSLGIEPCLVHAVYTVESAGSGFITYQENGKPRTVPKILFEGHIFWKELKKRGINPEPLANKYPTIIYPKWTKEFYTIGKSEHSRLTLAKTINEEAALSSASWGMFQIMGFNHKLCGYDNVFDFVDSQHRGAYEQLDAFCQFIVNQNLFRFLKNKDWNSFAKAYNGSSYAQNHYHTKLEQAYTKCKNKK